MICAIRQTSLPDEFYNSITEKVGNKPETDWGINLKLDKGRALKAKTVHHEEHEEHEGHEERI